MASKISLRSLMSVRGAESSLRQASGQAVCLAAAAAACVKASRSTVTECLFLPLIYFRRNFQGIDIEGFIL